MSDIITKKIKDYLLDFCLYGDEPLHIVFGALLDDKICTDARDAIVPILELFKNEYITVRLVKDFDTVYHKVNKLKKEVLLDYISKSEKKGFKSWPPGDQHYITTTKKGRTQIETDIA